MIDTQKLDNQLMLDEGLRLTPYMDQFGNLTTGVGRNLDSNPLSDAEIAMVGHDARSLPITHEQALFLLHSDEQDVFSELDAHLPWWSDLDDVRARVMVDLVFNMGITKLIGFHTFLMLMREGEYQRAGDDLAGTAWYGQVGNRGPRLVGMVTRGGDYTS